jgi:hypothetical protein
MNPWLTAGISAAVVIVVLSVRAIIMRAARKRRPRVIEQPNSHYTSQLVLNRDSSERWRCIPLDRMHEINRGEVIRLIAKLDQYGIDGMTMRERMFLDRMAELNPPPQDQLPPTLRRQDAFWADPFGFEHRLGTPDSGR